MQDLHIFGALETTSTTISKKKIIGTMNQPRVSKRISTTVRREMSLYLKTEQDIKVNGKTTSDTASECRFGQMELSMKDTGKTIKLMEKVSFGMSMATSTKVLGSVTKLMVMASTLTVTVRPMRETGVTIFSTERVLSSGTTIQNTRVSTRKVRSTARVLTLGKMAPTTPVNGTRTASMAKASILGTTVASIMETGKIITWMASASIPGKMAGSMKASTKKIRSTEMECIPGLMEESTTENGRMEDSTGKGSIYLNRASTDLVFGKMVKERDG